MTAFAMPDTDMAILIGDRARSSARFDPHLEAAVPHARRRAMLAQIVAAEILPRLALSHGPAAMSGGGADEAETAELVRLVMTEEAGAAVAFVARLRERGDTVEAIFLGVLTLAARRLGEFWTDDRCSFTEVTISVGRLQQVVRALTPDFQAAAVRANGHAVLLTPAPREQHTFGLMLVGEFFRRAGWHVGGGPVTAGNDAAATVRDTWYDVVGFSIGSEVLLDGLTQCIRRVRRSSLNAGIAVMVGGPLFLLCPNLVNRSGADAAAADGPGALRSATRLVRARGRAAAIA